MKHIIILIFVFNSIFVLATETFFDDFKDNRNNWYTTDSKEYESKFIDDKLHIKLKKENLFQLFWKEVPIYYERDFHIRAIMKQNSGIENHGYGLIWGTFDNQWLYYFVITSSGQASIFKRINGKWEAIKNWEAFGAIKPMENENLLEIKQKNKKMKFFINNELFHDTTGFSAFGNYVGFVLNDKMYVEVDDYFIKYETSKINLVDNPVLNTSIESLGANINSPFPEVTPIISADGNELYYCIKDNPHNTGNSIKDDIYYSHKLDDGSWSKSINVGFPLNNAGNNSVVSVSADGNVLVLMNEYLTDGSDLKGGGMSKSFKTEAGWSIPQRVEILGYYNRHPNNWQNLTVSSDNSILITAAQRDDSYGNNDIYVSFLKEGRYTEPMNLGPTINTFELEISPYLAPDNKTLYFSTSGHPGYGSEDIFMSKRLDDTWTNWSEPKNLGPGINSEKSEAYFTIPASGEYAYMTIYNPETKSDIYQIKLTQESKPDPVVLIYGKVLNSKDDSILSAEIEYSELISDNELGVAISDPISGEYKIILPYGKAYSFLASKKDFYSISENIDLTQLSEYKEIEKNLYLTPIEKGGVFRLNNVFFDYDKSDLRAESYPELDRLIEFLIENPDIIIEISGHTDSQGGDEYNLNLSSARAKSVTTYIIQKGIANSRVISKGFGETKPIADNSTEDGRQFNRRVEVKILN